jgi:hypothetical protein
MGQKLGLGVVLLRCLPNQEDQQKSTVTGANPVIALGVQLGAESSALQDFEPSQDVVRMAEVIEEPTHVWSTKQCIAVVLAAMPIHQAPARL